MLPRGSRRIDTTRQMHERVLALRAELRPAGSGEDDGRTDTDRPSLSQWAIPVIGILNLGVKADDTTDNLQLLKDTLSLLAPELLDRINQEVVSAGHAPVEKNRTIPLRAAVTPFWSRPMSMTWQTLICSTMRRARPPRPASASARTSV